MNDSVDNLYSENGEKSYYQIVSCANIIPLKRLDLIVKSLALINDVKIKWVHFGMGSRFDELESLAFKLLAQKSNITYELRGYVPVEDIIQFYRDNCVDCFITTSSTEGCPVSVQEAMSFGIPIIGTSVGEMPNMITENGVLLSENPLPEEIKNAICKICSSDIENTIMMRKCSRQLWECKYDAQKNTKNFLKELEKL